MTLLITLDTNAIDQQLLDELTNSVQVPCEFTIVNTTERERNEVADLLKPALLEVAVLDVARFDHAVFGGGPGDIFERALEIISNGSFPKVGKRDILTHPERNQLHDAMIFDAHVRNGRHIFVTKDSTGFVKHGRRQLLEELGGTRILTPTEFLDLARANSLG